MKKIYFETAKKWAIKLGIPIGSIGTGIGLIFLFLSLSGAITITGFSGDQVCAGTIDDPCYAYINFTAEEDIFIYPIGYDPWGRETPFEFSPAVKDWKLQRSWGKGWRDIPLDKTCTGTWCGAPNSNGVAYSWVLREARDYQIRIVAMKESPHDIIKWAVNYEDREYLDPTWYGPTNWTALPFYYDGDDVYVNDSNIYIRSTAVSNQPVIELMSKEYTGDINIVFGFNTTKMRPTKAEYNPHEVNIQKEYVCNYTFNYTTNPKYFWCYEEINNANGTITNIVFEHDFESGDINSKTAYWTEQKTEWDDVSGAFNSIDYDFQGMNKWYYKKNFSIVAGEKETLKLTIDYIEQVKSINEPSHKYWIAFYPSSETMQEAISNNHFYALDPWTESLNVDLEFYMKLDNSTLREELSGIDAISDTSTNTSGKILSARDYETGSSQFSNYGDNFDITGDYATFNAWIKAESWDWNHIYAKDDESTGRSFAFGVGPSGGFYVTIGACGGGQVGSMDTGTWYMVTAVWDDPANNMSYYINGEYVGYSTQVCSLSDVSSDFNIGRRSYSGAEGYFDGVIDEPSGWSRKISQEEITQLYNNDDGISYTDVFGTCTYSSGTWLRDCSENCTTDTNADLGGDDIVTSNSGVWTLSANITGFGNLNLSSGCDIVFDPGTRLISQ
jgi:hypothetical protein